MHDTELHACAGQRPALPVRRASGLPPHCTVITADLLTPLVVAAMVTFCANCTRDVVTTNAALLPPCGIVTNIGTCAARTALLCRLISRPPNPAGAVSLTSHCPLAPFVRVVGKTVTLSSAATG